MNQYVAFKPIIFLGQIGSFECFTWGFGGNLDPKVHAPWKKGSQRSKLPAKWQSQRPSKQTDSESDALQNLVGKPSEETHGESTKKTSREVQSPFCFQILTKLGMLLRGAQLFNCGSLVWTLPHVAVHCFAIHQAPRY